MYRKNLLNKTPLYLKSNTDHLHDGRYYTESEVDEKVTKLDLREPN